MTKGCVGSIEGREAGALSEDVPIHSHGSGTHTQLYPTKERDCLMINECTAGDGVSVACGGAW